jgi:hypothetical protein
VWRAYTRDEGDGQYDGVGDGEVLETVDLTARLVDRNKLNQELAMENLIPL